MSQSTFHTPYGICLPEALLMQVHQWVSNPLTKHKAAEKLKNSGAVIRKFAFQDYSEDTDEQWIKSHLFQGDFDAVLYWYEMTTEKQNSRIPILVKEIDKEVSSLQTMTRHSICSMFFFHSTLQAHQHLSHTSRFYETHSHFK